MRFVLASPVYLPFFWYLARSRVLRYLSDHEDVQRIVINFHRIRAMMVACDDACGCVAAVRPWGHPDCFSGISCRSRGWQWGYPADSRARGSSTSRRRVGVSRTRGIATLGTILAPFPSTRILVVDFAAVAAAAVFAVAAARTARSPEGIPSRLESIRELSWFTTELRAFAVGRHASVEDELMLRRKNSRYVGRNGTQKLRKISCNPVCVCVCVRVFLKLMRGWVRSPGKKSSFL